MTLNEFLKDKNKAEFSRLIGYKHPQALFRILAGRRPSVKVALKIEEATKNKVKLKDLLKTDQ